jgi:hypothetical protein
LARQFRDREDFGGLLEEISRHGSQ